MAGLTKCRACGQDGRWCSVYTSCSLNKGNAHDMRIVCIELKKGDRTIQFKHQFVYDGLGDGRHCIYCGIAEGK